MSAKKMVVVIWLAALTVISGMAWGEEFDERASLSNVYRLARNRDPVYCAARNTLNAALEKLPQARAGLLPTLNLTAERNRQFGEASFSYAPYIDRNATNWHWTLQLTQPLFRWSNWAAYLQADAQLRQAQQQFVLAEQNLALRVTQSYLDILLATENVRVTQAQVAAMREQLMTAERSFKVGTGTITDVHEAKARHALSLSQLVAAKNDAVVKQVEIDKIIGEPVRVPLLRPANSLPPLDGNQLEMWVSAATHSPQVALQQAALEVAEQEIEKNAGAHLPTLDLVLSQSTNFSSSNLTSPADIATRVESRQIGLSLAIPLFAGGATRSRVREATALKAKAKDDLTNAQREAESQVRQAFAGVQNGQAQTDALAVATDAARNAMESNKIGYRIGTRTNSDVLNAEQQLYSSLRDLMKARIETVMQSLKLKAAVGSLAEDDLLGIEHLLEPVE